MKILKYLTVVASIIFFASCEKNELTYAGEQDMPSNMAEFRLHYVEPFKSGSTTRFDSIYVNDVLYANSTNAYGVYNVLPNANKFYVAPVGEVNIKGWKKGKIYYEGNFNAVAGKQEVFMHDPEQAPVALPITFPYYSTVATGTAANWGCDSIAYAEFTNFMFEEYGTNKVPYPGKLQLQYQDARTGVWTNLGNACAFGESSGRVPIKIVRSVAISAGYCKIKFRFVDENGTVVQYANTKGTMVDYALTSDNLYIGYVYLIYARGIRTSSSIQAGLTFKTIH